MIDENNQPDNVYNISNHKELPPIEEANNIVKEIKLVKQNLINHNKLALKSMNSIEHSE